MTEKRFVKAGDKVIINPIVKKGQKFNYSNSSTLSLENVFQGEREVADVHDGYPVLRLKKDKDKYTEYYTIEMLCYPDYTKLNHPRERKQ